MKISRCFTSPGLSPFDAIEYEKRDSILKNTDGGIVAEMRGIESPKAFSQVASDILAQKYIRRAGVPLTDPKTGDPILDESGKQKTGGETSVKQVVHRLAGCWRHWGEEHGYFDTKEDGNAFYDELAHMLLNQMAAPNSPQWFNTGLAWAYGIKGHAQGHHYVDPKTGKSKLSEDAYTRPQPHACFIQSVDDDLVNKGGIMDLWQREARIFKYGSGTGTNFSKIRGSGESLSGGGRSSGLMSFLKIGDRAASAIKSGGTTRRAAKMVCLDLDHPDILDFVNWKVEEEKKVAAMIAAGYSHDYDGEAYSTVSGQASNNSIRIPHAFLEAVENDGKWNTTWRTTGEVAASHDARDVWSQISYAAWACADPGLQFDTTINDWHTCPVDGPIRASNPCSEYMFLDDTACNLASINLLKFYDPKTREFDNEGFAHACRVWTMVLEISVLMAQFPSERIARLSYDFRTLGLGYANLGAMLMTAGLAYNSDEGRAIAGGISALMTGTAYATSAEMAGELGAFPAYDRNSESMLRVIRNHRRAANNAAKGEYEKLNVAPMPINPDKCPNTLLQAARKAWDQALELGETFGYRNAQATVLAPTGTIGLLMDCVAGDTKVITEMGEYTINDLCDYAVTGGVQVIKVLSIDDHTGETSWQPLNLAWIKPFERELVEIETEGGATLRCTPDHKILTTFGWKAAKDLTSDDEVVTAEEKRVEAQAHQELLAASSR